MKKKQLSLLVAGLVLSGHLFAAPAYDINKPYQGGTQVNFNGQVFEAKWYVNPGQSPGLDYANDWDSPWTLIGTGEPDAETGGNGSNGGSTTPPPTTEDGTTIVYLTQAELDAKEQALTDFPVMQEVKKSIATRDNMIVEAVQPGRVDNPANVRRVESLLTSEQFEYLFPLRAPEYTYRGLLQAAAKFPALCSDYDDGRDADAICRKTLATMFAHFAQETGAHENWRPEGEWRQALHYVREMGWSEGAAGGYNGECNPNVWQGKQWPCGTLPNGEFKSYFGRGAKQLSYSYNYGPFSEAMYGTVRTLLDNPEWVADTWLNLASAVFFYTYPQPPKPSMLHVIDGTWQPNAADKSNGLVPGFGVTTQIINGGVECGGSAEHAQSQNRINYYRELANYFGVPVPADEVLGCKGMKYFDERGSGALPIYWEQNWDYVAENPNGGKSYSCKLVGYQTAYSAFTQGDYTRCVTNFFPEVVVDGDGETGGDNGGEITPPPAQNQAPMAKVTGPSEAQSASQITLSGQNSTDPEGEALSYAWTLPAGLTAPALDQASVVVTLPEVSEDSTVAIKLTVTDQGALKHSVTHTLVIKALDNGNGGEGEGEQGGGDITPPPSGDTPAYVEGTQYKAGAKVSHAGGVFECKPHPYTGWCAGAAWAYAPGEGTAWADAWIKH
ncbi:MAG: glycoside hydrolase family 19 protein [Aeromonas sp.]